MKIAYTMAPGRGDTDLLLCRVAQRLASDGFRCCGTVQTNTDCADGPCDMDVMVLPDGPVFRISQSLGRHARGCRLDPAALESAVAEVSAHLDTQPDVLIINKFGKHEADGRGFRSVIADGLSRDIPVLVGVNTLNIDAFITFAGPEAVKLDHDDDVLINWVAANTKRALQPA